MQELRLDNGKLSHNFAVFQDLVRTAESCLRKGKWRMAAAYAQMAAHHASLHHAGLWASPRLEGILLTIGRGMSPRDSQAGSDWRRNEMPKRVLHVLTEAYNVGGHTRLVWRWIQQDVERSHSVALTRQGSAAVPQPLIDAVRIAQGNVYLLDKQMGGLLSRVRALRDLAGRFDQIALHIHPFDVVPVIAFADKQKYPPVIFMNHADHVFWLGVGISDLVANIRESGAAVSQARRGIDKDRCIILPIPLSLPIKEFSHTQAKKQLGLPEDAVVLLSVAAAYKYNPMFEEKGFVDALLPVLKSHEKAVLLVIGPEKYGQWERGIRESQGRISVYGKRDGIARFYQAADIYLDSFPITSLTSVLEAGSYGVPLVTFSPFMEKATLLCADSPGFSDTLVRARDLESYRAEISNLVRNPKFRAQLGDRTRKGILDIHVGKGWLYFLEHLYSRAATTPPLVRQNRTDELQVEYLDIRLAALNQESGMFHGVNGIVYCHLGLLPFSARTKLWAGRFNAHLGLLPHCLLSEWARSAARKWIAGRRSHISPDYMPAARAETR